MSTTSIDMTCDDCGYEYVVHVECISEGCRESYSTWTGWSPAEGPEFDLTGPEVCPECDATLDTRRNEDRVIDRAMRTFTDDR